MVALGYLLGSIPTAYIAGHLLKGRDIRQMGDGNMGAANVFRQLGAGTGIAIFFIDASKGALAVLTAQATGIPQIATLTVGATAVMGHNWSVFIGFSGGRGLSTAIGVLATLITQPMLILAGPAVATLLITRHPTIASCVLFIPLSLVCWWLGFSGVLAGYSIALPCLLGITTCIKRWQLARTSDANRV